MKHLIVKVKEEKLSFFLELIKNLDFIEVEENDNSKEQIIESVQNSLKELSDYKSGKLELNAVEDLLNEL